MRVVALAYECNVRATQLGEVLWVDAASLASRRTDARCGSICRTTCLTALTGLVRHLHLAK